MPFSARVGRLDVDLGAALLLRVVEPGLEEDVGQERVVDLHQNAGRDDRLVFLAQLGGERMEILLVGLVIFVDADARRRGRRQKHVLVRHAGGLGGGFDVVDVDLQQLLAAIFDRRDADDRRDRHDRAAHHRLLEILRVVFRKGGDLLLEQQHLLVRTRFEAVEALLDVGEEAGLRELAVGDDIDAAVGLLAHDIGDRFGDHPVVGLLVVRLAAVFRLHQVEQVVRARQAADMGGLDAVGVLLDGHGRVLRFLLASCPTIGVGAIPFRMRDRATAVVATSAHVNGRLLP